ncbi:MAG: TatD family hydrolase [Sedimenticola sp.]
MEEEVGYIDEVILEEHRSVLAEVPNQGRLNRAMCCICHARIRHMRVHCCVNHLCWFACPASACWGCEAPTNKWARHLALSHNSVDSSGLHFSPAHFPYFCILIDILFALLQSLLRLPAPADLLTHVLDQSLFPAVSGNELPFPDLAVSALRCYCQRASLPEPDSFDISPPNHLLSITHWRILSKILGTLPNSSQLSVKECKSTLADPVLLSNTSPDYIDSHFHLDALLSRTRHHNFEDLESDVDHQGIHLTHLICNYVFPSSWSKRARQVGECAKLYSTVGVHPHQVCSSRVMDDHIVHIEDSLAGGGFVALGEVGLDFTSVCKHGNCRNKRLCQEEKFRSQRLFLRRVVPLAEQFDKVLVLHTRDHGDGSAAEEVRQIIVDLGLCHLRIHRHCFVGSVGELKRWVETFPNVHFGFTSTILGDPSASEVLVALDLSKILLETDSPYLNTTDRRRPNTPWNIESVCRRVAEVKSLPLSLVRNKCNINARCLYRI